MAVFAVAAFTGALACAEPLRIELKSGRSYIAEVDLRTTDERLWLRFGAGSAYLLRGVAWEQVARAERNGQPLTMEELRRLAPELATKPPEAPLAKPAQAAAQFAAPGAEAANARLTSVQFDAYLANWDADVEADGLVVRLFPLAEDGQLARVSGTLDVDLVAVRRRDFNQVPDGRGHSFDRIARWTIAISPGDIGPSGAQVRLPFQAIHPEFDTTVSPSGLVHLRYSAAGYGVFEASQDVVRIRPFAPLRDVRQQSGQNRFLDIERLGR